MGFGTHPEDFCGKEKRVQRLKFEDQRAAGCGSFGTRPSSQFFEEEGRSLGRARETGSIGDKGGMSEIPLPLTALALEQVPGALFPAQNLTGSCHLETLGNSLSSLCFS